jgi:hypothetical protein
LDPGMTIDGNCHRKKNDLINPWIFLGGKELKIKHPKAPFLSCLVFPSFYSFPRHFLKILRTKSSIGQFVEINTVNTYMFVNIFLFQF